MDYGLDQELRPAAGTAADAEGFSIAPKCPSRAKGVHGIRELHQYVDLGARDIIKGGLKWSLGCQSRDRGRQWPKTESMIDTPEWHNRRLAGIADRQDPPVEKRGT
jgi:hypothetical protein